VGGAPMSTARIATRHFLVPIWYQAAGSILRPLVFLFFRKRMGPWPRAKEPTVWLHAASLGETKGLLRLASALEDVPLTLTATTGSGLARLRRERPDLPSFLIPWDHHKVVARFLERRKVRCAVFLEAEIWPAALSTLALRQIPVALVAARCGPRSRRNWNRLRSYFPGVTTSFSTVWVDGPARGLENCGFAHLRDGASLKWAGFRPSQVRVSPHRSAAISIHLRDLFALRRLVRRRPGRAWLWFPRRLWWIPVFRAWARFLGLVPVDDTRDLAPGQVWIAPRFGLVHAQLPGCADAWVSPGHDAVEPLFLGVPELIHLDPAESVAGNLPSPEGTREAVADWIRTAR